MGSSDMGIMGHRAGIWLCIVLLPSLGCQTARSEVSLSSSAREARAEGCDVRLYPATPPPYQVAQVGIVDVECLRAETRRSTAAACLRRLVEESCRAGADTAFGFAYRRGTGTLKISAALGVRVAQPPWPHDQSCSPACSSGFQCREGFCVEVCEESCEPGHICRASRCVALCNPDCGEGFECSDERICVEVEEQEPAATEEPEATPEEPAADASG